MLNALDTEIAREFQRKLQSVMTVRDLRVYGSRARGEARPDSDLDLFVKVDSIDAGRRRQIDEIAWEVGFERDRVISTFVATPEQLQEGPLAGNPLLRAVQTEGVRL